MTNGLYTFLSLKFAEIVQKFKTKQKRVEKSAYIQVFRLTYDRWTITLSFYGLNNESLNRSHESQPVKINTMYCI